MERTYESALGTLHFSDPKLHVDNKSRHRSGHMSHAMVQYGPGKIIAFNSNCSPQRVNGHSAFGFVEYRYSEDYAQTWSDIHLVTPTFDALLNGIYTHSIEKAVLLDGAITCFATSNTQNHDICCEPWGPPVIIRSLDLGKSWEEAVEFCPWRGRIYDAKTKDGIIYVLMFCNPEFVGRYPDDVYRLFVSIDGGKTFSVRSVVDIDPMDHGYGALQFRPDGSLLVYACNIADANRLSVSRSDDLGKTWRCLPDIILKHGIRNVQIAPLEDGYVMHGRAWLTHDSGRGEVVYASKDGLEWDDGLLLNTEKQACYYSNMLPLKHPDGKEELLLQYSDSVLDDPDTANENNWGHVNVMHRFLYFA